MTRYWFKPKRYGYGATPVTWEGWLMTAAVCVAVAGSIVAMQLTVDRSDFAAWMIWAAVIVVAVGGSVRLSQVKTDGEWRWRDQRDAGKQ